MYRVTTKHATLRSVYIAHRLIGREPSLPRLQAACDSISDRAARKTTSEALACT